MAQQKKSDRNVAELIVADSESDANLYYATQFLVCDPVIFLKIKQKSFLILNDLELDRGKSEAKVSEVVSLSALVQALKKSKKLERVSNADLIAYFLKEKNVGEAIVSQNFSGYLASELSKRKIKITYRPDPFFKKRVLKTEFEKEAIRTSLLHTGHAIERAYEVLRKTKIKKNELWFQNAPLTSERLRKEIDLYLFENNCLAQHTIVAGGDQAVDPHQRGSGPLYANQAIVMDVFPKSLASHYFADMTRTVVKGKPSAELQKIWQAVKEAQEWAISQIRHGVNGQKIHQGILTRFEKQGFKTGLLNGRMQGFFHGTGHGLGLNIHEAPRLGQVSERLLEGMVVTVEPGLYYQGIGGVRIEDVVYVTKTGCEVLSSCHKVLSIE